MDHQDLLVCYRGRKCYSEAIFAAAARASDYVMWQMLLQFSLQCFQCRQSCLHMHRTAISFPESDKLSGYRAL